MLFIYCYFKQMTILSLDEELAHVSGVKINILQPLFYALLAATVVLGIKILGVALVSALLILPAASAQLLAPSFNKLLLFAVLFSEIITLVGIFLSFAFNLPTGAVIVLTGTVFFAGSMLFRAILPKKR